MQRIHKLYADGADVTKRVLFFLAAIAIAVAAGGEEPELFLVVFENSPIKTAANITPSNTICGSGSSISVLRSRGSYRGARLVVVSLGELYPAMERGVCHAAAVTSTKGGDRMAQIERLFGRRQGFRIVDLPG